MLRVLIRPTTYQILPIQDGQNPYIDTTYEPHRKKIMDQHTKVERAFQNTIAYTLDHPRHHLPDIVFTANSALFLPRLPVATLLLPRMKYQQRKEELPYLRKIFADLNLRTVSLPGREPFEGQAELKWFHGGTKAVCGYGHRSTKKSFETAQVFFDALYGKYNILAPRLLILPLESAHYYHLDVAMLEFDDTSCIVHRRAFSKDSIKKLKDFLGPSHVHVIDTEDSFCLNAVVDGNRLITHSLTPDLKAELESITKKKIHMVDTSEFEKSGGSVRCMTLDILNQYKQ